MSIEIEDLSAEIIDFMISAKNKSLNARIKKFSQDSDDYEEEQRKPLEKLLSSLSNDCSSDNIIKSLDVFYSEIGICVADTSACSVPVVVPTPVVEKTSSVKAPETCSPAPASGGGFSRSLPQELKVETPEKKIQMLVEKKGLLRLSNNGSIITSLKEFLDTPKTEKAQERLQAFINACENPEEPFKGMLIIVAKLVICCVELGKFSLDNFENFSTKDITQSSERFIAMTTKIIEDGLGENSDEAVYAINSEKVLFINKTAKSSAKQNKECIAFFKQNCDKLSYECITILKMAFFTLRLQEAFSVLRLVHAEFLKH